MYSGARPLFFCFLLAFAVPLCGCTSFKDYVNNGFKVGPNYGKAPARVANDWIDAADKRIRKDAEDLSQWWTVFDDPILDALICFAYQQNLTLRQAGWRVLEARAQRAIAVGQIFPQAQSVTADYIRQVSSVQDANRSFLARRFVSQFDFGFNLAWELDFWGRFRRAIESANANLDASVENYDDVLVTLLGDVAANYVQMRTFEKRIEYAKANVTLQKKTLDKIDAKVKFKVERGMDADQARSLLAQTEALIPELEIGRRLAANQLCILLGIPPEKLEDKLGTGAIPTVPATVAIGIPADLLRRRPDVRRAERLAAAQCAQIGVAESQFYPHLSIVGNIGYSANRFMDLFGPKALVGAIGPTFRWDILNYGRILNNVRLQDATFQELMTVYMNTVLTANREVEDGLVIYLRGHQRRISQEESVKYGMKTEKAVKEQYEAGTIDYTRLTVVQQNLVQQQDTLAQAQGEVALGLIQVYRALGGGWQIRETGCEVPPATAAKMGPPVGGEPR